MDELEKLEKSIERWESANDTVNWIIRILMVAILALVGSFLYDIYSPDDKTVVYHSGDTWLQMEGTSIDYPVMQGEDNFEYLDIDPDGNYYIGGSIFLDYRNSYDFTDSYNVVYGHNMAGGKMFSDLKKYYRQSFLESHSKGMLFTPDCNYELTVIGILNANAYDNVFGVTELTEDVINDIRRCEPAQDGLAEADLHDRQILALSTCSTSMDDQRDIVFCIMEETDAEYMPE